ncbi:hypothetical protein VO70_09660 [Aeromonas salmonicida]|nr:hypothetical protein VO70_09660 [Aeromonas salmonicida]
MMLLLRLDIRLYFQLQQKYLCTYMTTLVVTDISIVVIMYPTLIITFLGDLLVLKKMPLLFFRN